MQELDDHILLREYVERDSQEAFATLVARHVNKVYSVALRRTCNPIHAEEITESVFVILAQKAHKIGKKVILSSWLFQTARLTAITFVRSEIRRARREQEAYMQGVLNETETDPWPQIAPLLDEAVAKLNETDRHTIVLRFFDGKSMKEIGAILGASENATKKRVNRAVERLRVFFLKRGIVASAAILTATISANSVHAAPATLAKAAATVALAKSAAASMSTPTLVKGLLKLFPWANAKTAVVITATFLAVGTSAFVVQSQIKPGANYPASTWTDAGFDDLASAVKTLMWAISRNDAKTIFANLSPDCRAEFDQLAAQSHPPITEKRVLLPKWVGLLHHASEYRIVESDVFGEDHALVNLSVKFDGKTGPLWLGLKKFDGKWKLDDFDPKSTSCGRTGRPLPTCLYGGVGLKLLVDEQTHDVRIKKIIPDSPASRAGLSPGMVVESIDGVSTAKKSVAECVFLTRGLVYRHVWLTLVDPKQNTTNTIELERKPSIY